MNKLFKLFFVLRPIYDFRSYISFMLKFSVFSSATKKILKSYHFQKEEKIQNQDYSEKNPRTFRWILFLIGCKPTSTTGNLRQKQILPVKCIYFVSYSSREVLFADKTNIKECY